MQIRRYLMSDVLTHTLAVSVVLFLVVFSGRFISYLAEAAIGNITSDILLPVMLYKLPTFFQLILPLGLYIGILLSLGRLYAESEMVVLKACGVSPWQFVGALLAPLIVVTLIVAALSLYLAPEGSLRSRELLEQPRSAEGIQALAEGRFKKQRGGDFVSYAEKIDAQGVMRNVFIVERGHVDEGEVEPMRVTFASEGQIVFDAESGRRYMELRDGKRYKGAPGKADYEVAEFARYGELVPEVEGGIRSQNLVDTLPTLELVAREDAKARGALMWRLSLPILVPITGLIAFALSKTDARRGRYARLGPALVVFLVYFIGLTQSRGVVEDGGSELAFVATHAAFACLALLMVQWETFQKRLGLKRRA